ncbi:unnamed protein product [Prunus armeniaca]
MLGDQARVGARVGARRKEIAEAFIYLAGCTFSTARRGEAMATCGEADEGPLFCKRLREEEDDHVCFF